MHKKKEVEFRSLFLYCYLLFTKIKIELMMEQNGKEVRKCSKNSQLAC